MNEITLGEATAATMCKVAYAHQQLDAACIVTVCKGEQRFAKRLYKRILSVQRLGTTRFDLRALIEHALRRRLATRRGECHHSVHDIKRSHVGQCLRFPTIGQ